MAVVDPLPEEQIERDLLKQIQFFREKAALDFAFAAAEVPNGVTEEHANNLRKFWTDDDIVEIMGVIALFGFLNRWNDSMGSALEDLPIQAGEKYSQDTGWSIGKHC